MGKEEGFEHYERGRKCRRLTDMIAQAVLIS